MDLNALKTEITTIPLARSDTGMTGTDLGISAVLAGINKYVSGRCR